MGEPNEFDKLKKITGMVKANLQEQPVESRKDKGISTLVLSFIPSSKMIPIEEMMIEGNHWGFKDSEIIEEVEKLKKSGKIVTPKDGHLQKN